MTDQQRADTIPPFGRAHTPILDNFCRQGVTFTQAYCPSPHCCPCRASFFTGLYPSEHGVWNNVEVGNALSRGPRVGTRLFSDDLQTAGYALHFSGKWHVSSLETPEAHGWQIDSTVPAASLAAMKNGLLPPRQPGDWWSYNGPPPQWEWDHYMALARRPQKKRARGDILRTGYSPYTLYGHTDPDRSGCHSGGDAPIVDQAIDVIANRKGQDPWVQFIGIHGPHDPYMVPGEYLKYYSRNDFCLPANFADAMKDKPALYRRLRQRFDQLSRAEHREALHHYLAYCTYVDALFGRVLKALESAGDVANTMVVFTSDHGDYAGDHGLWTKGLPCFRGAYHIPAVIRWPAAIARPHRSVNAFVSTTDFAATFLDAAGIQPIQALSGRSLLPFLKQSRPPAHWRDAMFTQSNGNELYGIQRAVFTRDWKYVYNGFDADELYHLAVDPGETRNLAARPEMQGRVQAMCRRLWQFACQHQDVAINDYIAVAHAPAGPAVAFRRA